ncbi:MAG: phosphate signaling complex protein PhoU [Candidatus Acidiferrales bacterium]
MSTSMVEATPPSAPDLDAVLGDLLTMSRQVEGSVRQALYALRSLNEAEASQVFLGEARINELEVEIDEKAIGLLARGPSGETVLRLLIATLRITNDLERLGDQAVNVAERVVSLAAERPLAVPRELSAMADEAEQMVCNSLRALSERRLELAQQVLESDDRVDAYAESLARLLVKEMEEDARKVPTRVELLLASRTLERMADHATNIAEDVIFWLRGWDVRHRLRALAGSDL